MAVHAKKNDGAKNAQGDGAAQGGKGKKLARQRLRLTDRRV